MNRYRHPLSFLTGPPWPHESDEERWQRAGSREAHEAFAAWRPHSNSDTAAAADVKTAEQNGVHRKANGTRPEAGPTSTADVGLRP